MIPQNFQNHTKYYAPHHFIFYPVILLFTGISVWISLSHPQYHFEFMAIAVVLLIIAWLSFMLRQHYALGNQDRIVRLEMRVRYFQLTGKRLDPLENRLTFSQIAALRFAPDEELPGLVQRALDENLSSAEIKKNIKNWFPDHMRV